MRRSLFVLSLLIAFIILPQSCAKEEEKIPIVNVETGEKIAEASLTIKFAIEIIVAEIFKHPHLHYQFKEHHATNRMDCPDISPDPTVPITSFPANFTLNFGGGGCTPPGTSSEVSGQVELTLDGVLCQQVGTTACITFKNNFAIDGIDIDGKAALEYLGLDSGGNLCFASELPEMEVTSVDGTFVEIKGTSGGKLTLVDVLANNDPNDQTTYIDDTTCQSYSAMDACIDGVDLDLATTSDLKSSIACACPVGGVLVGTDASGDMVVITFGPACGDASISVNGDPPVASNACQ